MLISPESRVHARGDWACGDAFIRNRTEEGLWFLFVY